MSLHINITGFGEIQRHLPQDICLTVAEDSVTVLTLFSELSRCYPKAIHALERCACAVDDVMLNRQSILSTCCTLVLLSPVAGG
ncbi:MAG: MoaD/ThiS family protein [Acinetobacter sp.]|jgi:hypothetical protein|nr:MAG: MoaD/ThiS family protein [Acinetobacter sp.]